MAFIRSLIALLIAFCIAGFAVMNRNDVEVFWSPINQAYTVPLYVIILGSLIAGFLIGGIVVWLNHGGLRRTSRKQKKHIKDLEKELSKIETDPLAETPPSDFFPAIAFKKQKSE